MSYAVIPNRTDAEIDARLAAEEAARMYDSGWFAVSTDTIYSKTHGLGVDELLIIVFGSANSNGSDCHKVYQAHHDSSSDYAGGCFVDDVGTSTLEIKTPLQSVFGQNAYPNDDGWYWGNERKYATRKTSGYYRVIVRKVG